MNKEHATQVLIILLDHGSRNKDVPIYIQVTAEGKIAKVHVNLAGDENAKLVAALKKAIMAWSFEKQKPSRAGSCNIVIHPRINDGTEMFEMAPRPFEEK